MLEALGRWFGHTSFRDGQEDAVKQILAGRDLCVVMPTGAGKSLCYQLPILMRDGYGLVVSPLISLMRDQVDALNARGIPAAYINSTVPPVVQQRILTDVRQGIVKILYVAPERFRADRFVDMLRDCRPSLLVVDEAHCISQWGHDFRTDYLRLGPLAQELSIEQVCAFTATATPRVREDIRTLLQRPRMETMATGFQRPNLRFTVQECRSDADKMEVLEDLLADPAPTIIYTSSRKATEEVAAEMDCICYHAGLDGSHRHHAQSRFMTEECPVLVATNAFGMGIDRPDIRRVIHYNIPGSVEAYYQEAGRAGRDGEPAECRLLFAYRDRFIHEFLIDVNNPSEDVLKGVYASLRREAKRNDGGILEMTAGQLAAVTPEASNDRMIGAALRILEKHKAIRFQYQRRAQGRLRFLDATDKLRQIHQHESTQRSRFVYRLTRQLGADRQEGTFSIDHLTQIAGLRREQVNRVLRALQGDILEWTPPFQGRAIEIVDPEQAKLDIDFAAIEKKRQFELGRLEDMVKYTRGLGCRQRILVGYFGQKVGNWRCECCDNCAEPSVAGRDLTKKEKQTVNTILTAVMSLEGRFGRTRVARMLALPLSEDLGAVSLEEHPQRATLRHLGMGQVRMLVDELIRARCIDIVGPSDYPCIDITSKGIDVLKGKSPLKLALPSAASGDGSFTSPRRPKDPKKTTRSRNTSGDLLQALRQLRDELAGRRNIPPYKVLPNTALEGLAQRRPATPEEAMKVKGIGKVKARTVVPRFLEVIQEWQGS